MIGQADLAFVARRENSICGHMEKEKKSKISYFQSNVTATVSVALVLVLTGIIAFLGIVGSNITTDLKENMGISIILRSDATPNQIAELDKQFKAAPYAAKVQFVSKEEALAQWQKDTGENLIETFGVNTLSAEYKINVKAEYSDLPNLRKIRDAIKKHSAIEDVELYEAEVEAVNNNINSISAVLLVVAALLIFISFALINNTVRLTVYSRRFLIHTMKLVGAKPGFIRRPFVVQNMINGLIAAVVACLVFVGLYFAAQSFGNLFAGAFAPWQVACVFFGMAVMGVAICGLSAFFAADKYIRLDYDDLFKR